MSGDGWDVIGSVIGSVLFPFGGVLSALTPHAPQAPTSGAEKPLPYPGSTPGVPPYPMLPPPPGLNSPGSGGAAGAAASEASALAQIVDHLKQLDKSAQGAVEAIHAAGAAGQKALAGIQTDVDAKIAELGPRLNTPEGQRELREFLKDKLSSAKKILDDQIADAESRARQTRAMTQQYLDAAGGGSSGGGPGDGGGPGGGQGNAGGPGGGPGGGADGAVQGTTPAAAAPVSQPAPPYGQGLAPGMPGAGMMPMGLPSMPSFGGGGIPGFGGADPLGALSGLGGLGDRGPGFQDGLAHGESGAPKLHDADGGGGSGEDKGAHQSDGGTSPAAGHGSTGGGEQQPGDHGAYAGGGGAGQGGGGSTHVALPDGTSTEARTAQGAVATRAALGGGSVADAWHEAGVTVPPPGTPVTSPIPPTLLKAGDVGVWKDHLVMALGSNKVWVSGQVQPLTSVGSGPDFLGWMDPSAAPGSGGGPSGQSTSSGQPPTAPPPSSQQPF